MINHPCLFTYTTDSFVTLQLEKGVYRFECWGAQGAYTGGKGAYTKGDIRVKKRRNFYLYTGREGQNDNAAGSFNGGGPGQRNGGGASDIRLVSGAWDNFESLKSRIMVAAGGGGTDPLGKHH